MTPHYGGSRRATSGPTIAVQEKKSLNKAGISNYLFPNEPAMRNLAHSYDFTCERLGGPNDPFTTQHPTRGVFKLTGQDAPGTSLDDRLRSALPLTKRTSMAMV